MDRCPDCGRLYALVGLRHRCENATINTDATEIPATIIQEKVLTGRKRGRPSTGRALSSTERSRRRRRRLAA